MGKFFGPVSNPTLSASTSLFPSKPPDAQFVTATG